MVMDKEDLQDKIDKLQHHIETIGRIGININQGFNQLNGLNILEKKGMEMLYKECIDIYTDAIQLIESIEL